MTGLLEGKVAFVTGAARGQGRWHAIRLAQEGADVIAVDICEQIATVEYPMATEVDLSETVVEVEAAGGRIRAFTADVRDFEDLKQALDQGVAEFGRLDIVSANAGIGSIGAAHELSEESWHDMIDVNLRGVWHTAKAAVPHLIENGSGSIILTSSANGVVSAPMFAHYCAAKRGVIGLTKSFAMELASHRIRANAVLPGWVLTDMVRGYRDEGLMSIRYVGPTAPPRDTTFALDPVDVSDVVVFLASDLGRYVTGASIPVNGMGIKGAERMAQALAGHPG